jgi:lysophospholipase L1-like esterase
MKEQLGFAGYDNFGVSGQPTANGTANGEGTNTTGKSIADYSIYDLAVIATGTNDFKLNVPIGDFSGIGGTFDTTTFTGAYQDLVEYILKNSPTIRLALFTPLQRNNDKYDSTSTNKVGHKQIEYRNAILRIGEFYGLPVCDLYANSGFNMFTVFEYTMDGLHPHDVGYAAFSGYVVNFINSIASC